MYKNRTWKIQIVSITCCLLSKPEKTGTPYLQTSKTIPNCSKCFSLATTKGGETQLQNHPRKNSRDHVTRSGNGPTEEQKHKKSRCIRYTHTKERQTRKIVSKSDQGRNVACTSFRNEKSDKENVLFFFFFLSSASCWDPSANHARESESQFSMVAIGSLLEA